LEPLRDFEGSVVGSVADLDAWEGAKVADEDANKGEVGVAGGLRADGFGKTGFDVAGARGFNEDDEKVARHFVRSFDAEFLQKRTKETKREKIKYKNNAA